MELCFFSDLNTNAPGTPASAAWIGIAIAFYAFIAIGIAESGLGVLLPSILETFDLTPATVTLLFVSQIAGYVLAAFSSSLISSRLGLAPMLLVATIALVSVLGCLWLKCCLVCDGGVWNAVRVGHWFNRCRNQYLYGERSR
uniref:Uncharacterized protein n=1 Tax=Desertifilum tharense IPPAS B-1220 TaxID=1781255 RepID=A0ACD5H144_9CYAN